MNRRDRELGMGRPVSRRDFLEGTLTAAALAAGAAHGVVPPADRGAAAAYPPARGGLRGSQPGSFETAHQLAWQQRSDWDAATGQTPSDYDLVVVGAGISGLAAARFYQDSHANARILILDNHDDFGGHARRNEFRVDDRTLIGYGGSQSLEAPGAYSATASGLLRRLGVNFDELAAAYDQQFYLQRGLASSIYFDRDTYGVDRVLCSQFLDASLFVPHAQAELSALDAIAHMPISPAARAQLAALVKGGEDRLPQHSLFAEPELLGKITYQALLTDHLGVTEPEVLALLRDMPGSYFGYDISVVPALEALAFGLPGLGNTSLGSFEGLIRRAIRWASEPYIYHFPDGNASLARLLVRSLIPEVTDAAGLPEIVTAHFDYSKLDPVERDVAVRLRLASTVVNVEHDGPVDTAAHVRVRYVNNGTAHAVRARHVVMACYNMVIPHVCPELPTAQKGALKQLVKAPLVYSNVVLRNWHAFERLGIALAVSPGRWFKLSMLDFPVSMPGYGFAANPNEPIVLHMNRAVAHGDGSPEAQARQGRYELLSMPFEAFEREIRTHLAGMLAGADFDPARDIAGITVNRWPHGYAWRPNAAFHPEFAAGQAPHELGRRPLGRITIANSDAGARAYVDCAIDQAHRAVSELPV